MHIVEPMREEKNIHRVFVASLILKGVNSIIEIFGGLALLVTGSVTSLVAFFIREELVEDPTDFIATHIQHIAPYFSAHSQLYASFYLLSHGIVKIILVISLLRNRLWAYPATIGVTGLFIAYQAYRLAQGFSLGLVLLTILDFAIIGLTWHEYKVMKAHPRFSSVLK